MLNHFQCVKFIIDHVLLEIPFYCTGGYDFNTRQLIGTKLSVDSARNNRSTNLVCVPAKEDLHLLPGYVSLAK